MEGRLVAVEEIAGKHCECGEDPSFTMPLRTPDGPRIHWLCAEHAGQREREGNDRSYPIVPTCHCGETRTHIALAETEDGELRPISRCEQHKSSPPG